MANATESGDVGAADRGSDPRQRDRASGDAILVLVAVVATMCLAFYGFEDGGTHAIAGLIVLGGLAAKVLAVRLGGRLGRLLPLLGISLATLLMIVWLTSAGDFLGVSG